MTDERLDSALKPKSRLPTPKRRRSRPASAHLRRRRSLSRSAAYDRPCRTATRRKRPSPRRLVRSGAGSSTQSCETFAMASRCAPGGRGRRPSATGRFLASFSPASFLSSVPCRDSSSYSSYLAKCRSHLLFNGETLSASSTHCWNILQNSGTSSSSSTSTFLPNRPQLALLSGSFLYSTNSSFL